MSPQATFYTLNRDAHCPHCGSAGGCRYLEIPESIRSYIDEDGAEQLENFGETHEYRCDNCDARWVILNIQELTE